MCACVKLWAKEKAKNGEIVTPPWNNNTGEKENWSVLQIVVPTCLNCEFRCVGFIKTGFKTGDLECQHGEGRRI